MSQNVSALLRDASVELCAFLAKVLPHSGDHEWWQQLVVDQLSVQHQQHVEQQQIHELSGLDLAALLQILDKNWYAIHRKVTLSPDARHYVREMQTVSKHWAPASLAEHSRDDIYRDLDTLQRFLSAIDAAHELQDRVRKEREALLERDQPVSKSADVAPPAGVGEQLAGVAFQLAQMVRLKSDASKTGPVIKVQELQAENRYQVFIDGAPRWFYGSQLEGAVSENEGQGSGRTLTQVRSSRRSRSPLVGQGTTEAGLQPFVSSRCAAMTNVAELSLELQGLFDRLEARPVLLRLMWKPAVY